MKLYGSIKFSTVDAPQPIAGICEAFTYRQADQVYEIMGEDDLEGIVLHGRKGEVSFSSTPAGNVTALGVRAGAEITITGVAGGKVVVTQSSARWQRGAPMTMEAQATHYPDISGAGSGTVTPATIALSAGSGGPLVLPAGKVWFGARGIDPGIEGIVQGGQITEQVQVMEIEDNDGKITAVAVYGYKASATVEVVTTASIPALGEELNFFGGFRITRAEERWQKGQARLISVEGLLVPGIS